MNEIDLGERTGGVWTYLFKTSIPNPNLSSTYKHTGYPTAIAHILLCGAVQLLVAYPFLYDHPVSYLSKARNRVKRCDYPSVFNVCVCVWWVPMCSIPFLYHHPVSYLSKARAICVSISICICQCRMLMEVLIYTHIHTHNTIHQSPPPFLLINPSHTHNTTQHDQTLTYTHTYIYPHIISQQQAFELSRVFEYQWTVNFRFLSEEVRWRD